MAVFFPLPERDKARGDVSPQVSGSNSSVSKKNLSIPKVKVNTSLFEKKIDMLKEDTIKNFEDNIHRDIQKIVRNVLDEYERKTQR